MRRAVTFFFAVISACLMLHAPVFGQELGKLKARRDSLAMVRQEIQWRLSRTETEILRVNSQIDSIGSVQQQIAEVEFGSEADSSSDGVPLYVVVAGRIRTGKASGKIVAHVPFGAKLVGLEFAGSYWRVQYEGKEGWFLADHVRSEEKRQREQRDREMTDRAKNEAQGKGFGLFLRRHWSNVNSADGVNVGYVVENIGSKEMSA